MGVLASAFKSEELPVSRPEQMELMCLLMLQTVISCVIRTGWWGRWESLILRAGGPGGHSGENVRYSSTPHLPPWLEGKAEHPQKVPVPL